MLQDLPVEVIQQIIAHLPTASAIAHLSQTNHKLHAIVAADQDAVYRAFVRRAFPSIKTPPYWKDAARVLTSRSRAWDRRAFIARECFTPGDGTTFLPVRSGPQFGYHPVIDSYETWQGDCWSDRKQVLAWGAAGRLQLRTVKDGVTSWSSWTRRRDERQELDILNLRLLRPHQHENAGGESIVVRRANHEIVRVDHGPNRKFFHFKSRFLPTTGEFTCMDVSLDAHPLLVACDRSSIHLYPVHTLDRNVQPVATAPIHSGDHIRKRMRCSRFLSDRTVAVGVQHLQGRARAPIKVFDIAQADMTATFSTDVSTVVDDSNSLAGRQGANVIVPLDDLVSATGRPQPLMLSGWTDGVARLHDLRVPVKMVAGYVDVVDDGQILSLLPIGHERFLAGSHQNGCLKTFDLRMPGARCYSYLDARPPSGAPPKSALTEPIDAHGPSPARSPQRDVNIFLTPNVEWCEQLWQPLPRRPGRNYEGYRGSVYSLSSPSPSSPTIYAGIENHVMQLDFVSTDDYHSGTRGLVDSSLGLDDSSEFIFDFSCYERPREGHESTDAVLLRKQVNLHAQSGVPPTANARGGMKEDGWDPRWRLQTYDRARTGKSSWRG